MVSSGIVKAVTGSVKAIAVDGSERILQVGHRVLPNEQIITGDDGTIALGFSDGTLMDLGRSSDVTLNKDTLAPDESNKQTSQTLEDAQGEVAAAQKALAEDEDFDPSELDAPAAGGAIATSGAENEGSTTVRIDYLNPTMTPENGFDTTGINVIFPEPIEELLLEPDEDEPVSVAEIVNVTDSEVDESSGINTIVSGALNIDGSAPQDVSLSAANAKWDAANKALSADDNSYRIDINNDGTYTFTFLNALNHPAGQGESNKIDFNISAELTSDNGSVFNTSFNVTVYDDGPIVDNYEGSITDYFGQPTETLPGLIDYDLGLDGLGSVRLEEPKGFFFTSQDDPVSFEVADNNNDGLDELYAYIEKHGGTDGWDGPEGLDERLVFTLEPETPNESVGSYKLVLHDVLDLPGPIENPEELDVLFEFTATDNDGDNVLGTFTVTFDEPSVDFSTALGSFKPLEHLDSVDLTA